MKKLKEIFPDVLSTGAIFKRLEDNNRLPWSSVYSGSNQDVEYLSRSGDKCIAPLVSLLIVDGALSSDNLDKLCGIVWGRYGSKWSKLWDTLQIEYDPLKLFHVKTTENIARDNTGTVTDDRDTVRSNTGSNDGVSNGSSNDNIFGYNSINASPANSGTNSNTTNNSYKDDGKVTDDLTRTLDTNETVVRTNEREGNVGLVSAQSLIKQELELRAYDLFNIVYRDLDKMMTLAIYESEV